MTLGEEKAQRTLRLIKWKTPKGVLRLLTNVMDDEIGSPKDRVSAGTDQVGTVLWTGLDCSRSPYFRGFLLTLPLMGDLFKPSLGFGRERIRRLLAGEREGVLAPAFKAWRREMEHAASTAAEAAPKS